MDHTDPGAYTLPPLVTAGDALGIPERGLQYTFSPETLVKDLQTRASRAAKLIARELDVPRHAAFDAIARAGGFADWQHLSRHLAGAAAGDSGLPGPASVNWDRALVPLLPLAYRAEPGFEVPAPLRAAFAGLAEKLGQSLGAPVAKVLDQVCAPLLGERAWADVEARRTTGDGSPLYSFKIDGQGGSARGEFRTSRLADMLTEQLEEPGEIQDEYLEDILNDEENADWLKFVTSLEDEHPDFLEGGLGLARLRGFEAPQDGLDVVSRYVARAGAIIPRGFRGKLSWHWPGNRFYFRLLWLQADLAVRVQNPALAARALRKLDGCIVEREVFDVRWVMPYFLMLAGDGRAARKACDKLPQKDADFAWVARAFAAFACGDRATFRLDILRAVFLLYGLRELLTLSHIHGSEELEALHASRKGGKAFNWLGLRVLYQVPSLLPAVLDVLNEPEVVRRVDLSWAHFWSLPITDAPVPGAQEKAAIADWMQDLNDALQELTQVESSPKESA